jgi:hypothetical protein
MRKRVFCQSTARRLLLFAALAKWGDETVDKYIIGSMAASRDLTEEEHDGLRKAMTSIYARDAARNESARGIWRSSVDDWYELLKSDFQRTHSDVQPIDCQK